MKVRTTSLVVLGLALALVLVAGLRPVGFDRDSLNYAAILGTDFGGVLFGAREPTFWLIDRISQVIPGDHVTNFFLIYALLGVALKLSFIARYSQLPIFSVFVYVALYFVGHEMTQIRTGVAAGIYLFALASLSRGDRRGFTLMTLLATCFHYSAVVGLVMMFAHRLVMSRPLLLCVPFAGIAVGQLIGLGLIELVASAVLPSAISARLDIYLELLNGGEFAVINLFNPVSMSYLLVYLVLVVSRPRELNPLSNALLLSFGLGLAGYFAFSILPVLAFRVMEFMTIGVIVLMANATLWWRQRQLWICFSVIWCMAVFFTQSLVVSLGVI